MISVLDNFLLDSFNFQFAGIQKQSISQYLQYKKEKIDRCGESLEKDATEFQTPLFLVQPCYTCDLKRSSRLRLRRRLS